jgi:hypothetical protein
MAANVRVNQSAIELIALSVPNVRVNQSCVEFISLPFTPPPTYGPIIITLRGVKRRRCGSEAPDLAEVKEAPGVKRAV